MNRSERWEEILSGLDRTVPESEEQFVHAVMKGIEPRRRWRRTLVSVACLLATIISVLLLQFAPVATHGLGFGNLGEVLAALTLTALCGIVWVSTDELCGALVT